GEHSSGRNSGVLHAGLYYAPGSLKARLCVDGARLLREYLEERSLPVLRCGKVIVAQTPELASSLDELEHRARANGVRIERLDERALAEVEPEARSFGEALHSPDTWS